MVSWLTLLLSFTVARADYQPRLHQIKCSNVESVAKEAVAYSLLGAWQPFADHGCFKSETFKYFNPRAATPEGDVLDFSKVVQFHPGRDTYSVGKTTKNGSDYRIPVDFLIAGRKLHASYVYHPDPEYTGRTGICGFVTNPAQVIVRSDCIRKK